MKATTRFRQVLAVAEHGSFRRAAAALKVSQPALTKSVQAVEAYLGVRIFDRQPRSVTLTEFGRRVVTYGKGLVAAEADLRRDLALVEGLETGSVEVAFGPYPSVISGYAAAAKLVSRHPRLDIALHVADWRAVTKMVAARQADLGVAELSDATLNDALATELVGEHRGRMFCRCDHPLVSSKRVTLSDLLRYPWAGTRAPPRIAAALPRPPGRAGRIDELTGDFIPVVQLDVPMQLAAFAKESDTLVFGTLSFLERELETGTLAALPVAAFEPRTRYGFIYLRNRSLSPGMRAFMQTLREEEAICVEREGRLEKIYT